MSQTSSVIVVVLDRLGAGFLGPYGNTWIETPWLNRLASQAVLWETAIADSLRLEEVYRSYWHGMHAMCTGPKPANRGLPELLGQRGLATALMTDEARVADHPAAGGFSQHLRLSPPPPQQPAQEIEQTQLAQFFAQAVDWLGRAKPPFVLWLHARAMEGPWDAPLEFRNRFRDEDDPPPPGFVSPPNTQLGEDYDPDEILGVTQAYAGQVVLADLCVGALLDALSETGAADETALLFTSPRGFPLGEHGGIGLCGDQLFGEALHVPLLLRLPHGRGGTTRVRHFAQPSDVYSTVLDCLGLPGPPGAAGSASMLALVEGRSPPRRDRACAVAGGQRAIRTPAWFLRQVDQGPPALYAKPDDRWEVNEVADRCRDIVQSLIDALDQFEQSLRSCRPAEIPSLPPELVESSGYWR